MTFSYKYKLFLLIFLLTSLNFLIVFFTSDTLDNNFSFGPHTISLYFQLPFLTLVYIWVSLQFNKSHYQSLLITGLTFLPSILILLKYLLNEIDFYQEDNLEYDLLAKYFINENTIFAKEAFKVQPGYAYYLTIIIGIFENQNRLTQLLNIILCFILLSIFINIIKKSKIEKKEKYFIYYLFFSSTFFISQNILFSISEWLTFSLGFYSVFLVKRKHFIILSFVLGYMVLLRTNLVLINTFFILLIFFYVRRKSIILIFFSIIILPFLHNYLVHNDFSFFVTRKIIDHGSHFENIISNPIQYSFDHFLSYLGISKNYVNLSLLDNTFIVSIITLPFFFIYFLKTFLSSNFELKMILFFLIFLSSGITFFHGWAYYPRFQLTNYIITLLYFVSIKNFLILKNFKNEK